MACLEAQQAFAQPPPDGVPSCTHKGWADLLNDLVVRLAMGGGVQIVQELELVALKSSSKVVAIDLKSKNGKDFN